MVVTELPNLSPAALPRTHTLHNSPTSELYAAMMEGTPVVVKRTKITSRGEILRFEKEVALLLECSHPNVVQPLAQMRAPPTYAFVMPLFAHGALFGVLHNSGQQLSLRGALSVIADVSSAVTHLHAVGVLHRDVKSDNVLLDGSWRAVLVDFNAAERTVDICEDIVAPSRPSGAPQPRLRHSPYCATAHAAPQPMLRHSLRCATACNAARPRPGAQYSAVPSRSPPDAPTRRRYQGDSSSSSWWAPSPTWRPSCCARRTAPRTRSGATSTPAAS